MQNISLSPNPSVLLVGYSSVFATLMGPSLIADAAIAQPTPHQPTNPTSLSTLALDFSHPFSPQSVNFSDRPDPSRLSETKALKSNPSTAVLDFTLPPPLVAKDLGAVNHESVSSRSVERQSKFISLAPLPLDTIFSGNSNSLIAIAIGSAEGTRSPDGGKTWAYNGHTDPGNGVWNMGTFSWQHGANSPEEADRKQLARLRKQAIALTNKAEEAGIPWGLEEQLNALDLANQSPSAALNAGGYTDRLKEAQAEGLKGSDAILWARTWSYRHPSGTRWNAPGLGNTHHGIRTDQKRRQDAIKAAIAHYFD